jgi:hypothetical protein
MADVLRVRTDLETTATNPMLSTMFFTADVVTPAAARAAVGAFWGSLGSAMSQNVDWVVEHEVERINVETGHLVSVLTDSTDWIGSGTIDSEELPQATQGLIRWSTGTIAGGRRLQGHTFIPGTTENMSDNGVPSSTLLGKYQTAADLLATDDTDANVIWSRRHGVAAIASSGRPWAEFAVLRSRRD